MIRLQMRTRTVGLPFCVDFDLLLPECPNGTDPADYYRRDGDGLPVLFLLHGGGGAGSEWPRLTRIEEMVQGRGLAVVCPSTQNSDYNNMYRGYPWLDWLTGELYDYVHAVFPLSLDREKNFVAGQSMGGYGAIQCALTRPDRYSCAGLLSSGVGLIDQVVARSSTPQQVGGPSSAKILASFGPAETLYGSEHDSYHLAEELARRGGPLPRVFSVCGTEDHCYPGNCKLRDVLRANGYDLTWVEGPGAHTWDFWDRYMPQFLDWLPL